MTPFRASVPITNRWQHFSFEVSDRVAQITLNRPDLLNALTFDVYADLRDLFRELPHREDVGVAVLTGSGRGFCAGGDVEEIIGELVKFDARALLDFTRMTGAVVQAMRECPLPIIAAVNGVAAGAGSVLALASDFRVMARSASFHFLFTRVGLAGADMGAAYLLPRIVGLGRATELLMLGDRVDAADAERLGLAYQVVDDELLREVVSSVAARLASGPALAQEATKALLTRELDASLGSAIEMEAITQALLMTSQDHREFLDAFRSKRAPVWSGR
jgi:enoyl-CoA hydratase/carnithine racemase